MSKKNNVKKPRATVRPECKRLVGPREIADELSLLPGSPAEKLSKFTTSSNGKILDDAGAKSIMDAMVHKIFPDDDASELADIDRMARLMGFSIFDATVKVTSKVLNSGETIELVLAAFILGKPRIFGWLTENSMNGKPSLQRKVGQEIVDYLEYFPDGSVKQKMAVAFIRRHLKCLHEDGELDSFLEDTEVKWHSRPFGATVLADFQAEIYAARERRELEELLTVANDDAIDAPAVAKNVRAGPIRM
jgi:hypothetical protein